MTMIKYPLKEIELSNIKSNRLLAVGVNDEETEFYEKNIRQHGLLTPLVIMENKEGEQITVCGETEIRALRNMGIKKTEVMVSELKNKGDIGKITLLMSGLRKGLSPITEGLILKEMLETGDLNQKELSFKVKKSQGWISKRLALVNNLKETVIEMVLSQNICPKAAEEIAKLPQAKQHGFAIESNKSKLTKRAVEKLVLTYRNSSTPEVLKNEIITNPSRALISIADDIKVRKINQKKKEELNTEITDIKQMESAFRLFLKLVNELEGYMSKINKETIVKYTPLFVATRSSCRNLYSLINNICIANQEISPGNNLKGENAK